MNKKTITQTAITSVILITLFAVFLIGLGKAFDSYEEVECYKLQNYAEEYKNFLYSPIINEGGFYITSIEKEMCDYHGIVVNAPVR